MTHLEIRKKFLDFFSAKGGPATGGKHVIVPSSSLVPDDPSVLLTTAGMQQFKPYFTGDADPIKDFDSKNTISIQKSFRTSDIDEVGDETHLTFFEMLGNFSFGGYFKKDAITWAHEFITKELELEIDYITVFGGADRAGEKISYDEESEKVWRSLGISDIHVMGLEDNFWGPTGNEGPCGPTTEIYAGGTEIWNIVFNEFYCKPDGSLENLKTPGVDTGMGLERLLAVLQKKNNIFETDLFVPLMAKMSKDLPIRVRRIIADHVRATVFLLSDGVRPSNKETGYILRRLIRRSATHAERYRFAPDFLEELAKTVMEIFESVYPELKKNRNEILNELRRELEKFSRTLKGGLRALDVMVKKKKGISGKEAFDLYQSYGLPPDVLGDVLKEKSLSFDPKEFEAEFKKHQNKSKEGQEKKFGGHGLILDTGELKAETLEEVKKVTRLHTATHLLQAALRKIFGPEVRQMGSDITARRLRFDFTFGHKLTIDELKKVEDLVNDVIAKDLSVIMEEMDYRKAKEQGALSFFKLKYPKRVKVYSVEEESGVFSRELCGGPHVKKTGEIEKFIITKEESVASGVRRIRATVEP
ncbi:alanine--tRNA ligase [Patescibacteria group bacterium]|nr:alanine--tRNA ligase [Patescibacteria group bacterium]